MAEDLWISRQFVKHVGGELAEWHKKRVEYLERELEPIAQRIEQIASNNKIGGSIPPGLT